MNKLFKVSVVSLAICASITACAQKNPANEAKTAAQSMIDAYNTMDVAKIYSLLPATYQKDIIQLSKDVGAKIDPEIWTAATKIICDISDVANTKADLIVQIMSKSNTEKANPMTAADIKAAAQSISAFAKSITIDSIKAGDIAKILAKPELAKIGSIFAAQNSFTDVAGSKITSVVPSENNSYKITVTKPNGETDDETFVNVDGKWIPEDFTEGWTKEIKDMRDGIAKWNIKPEQKTQFLSLVPMLSAGITQMKTATTVEQLQQSASAMMLPLMMMGSMNDAQMK